MEADDHSLLMDADNHSLLMEADDHSLLMETDDHSLLMEADDHSLLMEADDHSLLMEADDHSLLMEAEKYCETSDCCSKLKRLVAREDFIAFSRRESFKSYLEAVAELTHKPIYLLASLTGLVFVDGASCLRKL
jgi:hypothetical protein